MPRPNPNNYSEAKALFRTLGPVLCVIGGVLLAIAVIDFFSAFNSGGGTPKLFFLGFIGIPVLGVGSFMVKAGYLREITEYTAEESSPAITTVARAAREGWTGGATESDTDSGPRLFCSSCGVKNDLDAKFCDSCGSKLSQPD